MYEKKGQVAFALEEYNKLVRLYPEDYNLHIKLAELYKQVNELDKTKVEYLRAMNLGHRYRYKANIELVSA